MLRLLATNLFLFGFVLIAQYSEAGQFGGAPTNRYIATKVLGEQSETPLVKSQGHFQQYTNGKLGFTIAVPISAEVRERKGTNQISVRSRKGYVINIQAGPKRPHLPLAQMSTLLEAKYLGEGKPWKTRGSDGPRKIANMPAHEVAYQGAGSKTRVVIARGKINDYVFIFIASTDAFKNLESEFEWLLANFRPNSDDFIISNKQGLLPKNAQLVSLGAKRFAEPRYGYTIEYPAAWEMSKLADMTTMFSGRDGSPDYEAIVTIQNIKPRGVNNPNEAGAKALKQLKQSLGKAVNQFAVVEDKVWRHPGSVKELIGRQLLIRYEHQGVIFQKRMIVMPRLYGTVVHVWSYTAPKSRYTSLRSKVDLMLKSWAILTDPEKI